jgi:hypothetical protein
MKGQHHVSETATIDLMILLSDLARRPRVSLGNVTTHSRKTIKCVGFVRSRATFVATSLSISGQNEF